MCNQNNNVVIKYCITFELMKLFVKYTLMYERVSIMKHFMSPNDICTFLELKGINAFVIVLTLMAQIHKSYEINGFTKRRVSK